MRGDLRFICEILVEDVPLEQRDEIAERLGASTEVMIPVGDDEYIGSVEDAKPMPVSGIDA